MKTMSQKDYFFAMLLQIVLVIFASFYLNSSVQNSIDFWIGSIIALSTFIYVIITTNRRLNDAKWSQLLLILLFVPFIGFIFQILLAFAPTRGDDASTSLPKLQPIENDVRSPWQHNKPTINSETPQTSNNAEWEIAFREYHSQDRDIGLYAKLFALYDGDENKIQSHYLRERVAFLQSRSMPIQDSINENNKKPTQLDVYGPITNPNQIKANSGDDFLYTLLFIAGLVAFFFLILVISSRNENKFVSSDGISPSATASNTSERLAVVSLTSIENLELIALLPTGRSSCSESISNFERNFMKYCVGCKIETRSCTDTNGFENYLNNQRAAHDYIADGFSRIVIIGDNTSNKARAACYRYVDLNKKGQCIEKL